MKYNTVTPHGERTLVKSRGVAEEMDSGLIVPKKFLRNSDVCTTQDGRTVIVKSHSDRSIRGMEIEDGLWIVENKDILAELVDGAIIPKGKYIHARKCLDVDDGIERVSERYTQFVEVIAAGGDAEGAVGDFGYVEESALGIQKIEDTNDDWLIDEEDILFYIES